MNRHVRKRVAKTALINEINTILRNWNLCKKDLAIITSIPYDSVQKGLHLPDRMSDKRIAMMLEMLKTFTLENKEKHFNDIKATEEMINKPLQGKNSDE